jgi:hypothetical protein
MVGRHCYSPPGSINHDHADTYAHLLEGVGRQAAEAADALVPRRRDQSVTKLASETPRPSPPTTRKGL